MFKDWSNVAVGVDYHDCLPQSPGVYFFVDGRGVPVYVGQAKNLRERHKNHQIIIKSLVDCGSYSNLAVPGSTGNKGFRVHWDLCEEENLLHREAELFKMWSAVGACELNGTDPGEQLSRRQIPTPSDTEEEVKEMVENYLWHWRTIKLHESGKEAIAQQLKAALTTRALKIPHYQGDCMIYVTRDKSPVFVQKEPVEYSHLREQLSYHQACNTHIKWLMGKLEEGYLREGVMVESKGVIKSLSVRKLT